MINIWPHLKYFSPPLSYVGLATALNQHCYREQNNHRHRFAPYSELEQAHFKIDYSFLYEHIICSQKREKLFD